MLLKSVSKSHLRMDASVAPQSELIKITEEQRRTAKNAIDVTGMRR